MATKLPRKAAKAAAEKPENELETLHPERTIQLRGASVTVREYGHVEWLRMRAAAAPLVSSIAQMLEAGQVPRYEDALDVLAQHVDGLIPLVREACGMTAQAFEALNPEEGELLLMTWWGVNGRFFVQRALNRVAVSGFEKKAGAPATERSTPPSSPTVTPEPRSAATPSDS